MSRAAKRLSDLVRRAVAPDPQIVGVTADSRKVKPGFLFAALPGTQIDGRAFAAKAAAQGAAAILAGGDVEDVSVPVVVSPDPRRAYALAAANFWDAQPATCVATCCSAGRAVCSTITRR